MKTRNYFVLAALSLFLSTGVSAQVIEKDLTGSGDWKAAQVAGHDLWKKNACLAYTKSSDGKSILEVYAQQEGETKGSFLEPTVQVQTKETGYVRGILTDSTGATYHLTLASTREEVPAFGLMARLQDRTKIIQALKKGSAMKLQLVNAKGKAIKSISFSLKGSTKTIDGVVSSCQLML